MLRLPHNKRSRIQLTLVLAFLAVFLFATRYAAIRIQADADAFELHQAIDRGDIEELKRLLQEGNGLNGRNPARNGQRDTPLHFAIWHEKDEFVHVLLEHGANPNTTNKSGNTPLHTAAQKGRMDYAKLLVEHGANIHALGEGEDRSNRKTPALMAMHNARVELARYLLFDAGEGDFSREDVDRLLEAAAARKDIDLVKTFLQAGASPKRQGDMEVWPLLGAIQGGSYEIILLMLEHGATLQGHSLAQQANLMLCAGRSSDRRIVDRLVAEGLDPNVAISGETALHEAIFDVRIETARALIDHGANVNARGSFGDTPLHRAAQYGSLEVARLLIRHGANLNARNDGGETPLHYAAQHAELEFLKLLIESGANPVAPDDAGRSPAEHVQNILDDDNWRPFREEHGDRHKVIIEYLEEVARSQEK